MDIKIEPPPPIKRYQKPTKKYKCCMCGRYNGIDFLVEIGMVDSKEAICGDCKVDIGKKLIDQFLNVIK